MRQVQYPLIVDSPRQGLIEISAEVIGWVEAQGMRAGLITLFCAHSSASLLIQENAAPEARADIERYFARIAPEDSSAYAHDDEGPDDMPAHLRAALTQTHLSIPLIDGRLALGRWQGIFLFEHRRHPQRRTLILHMVGE
ncbi:secondary thiamine-phosphate synthase enzyme YjbQ [Rhizorhabdus sp. FW153]|uniref:secondary thiamine-phosphate synthase enzyme YjbQ n=1 Tax=Rhizorhabdus sp. FW153 TaxID=3400216 RepID=UPI003CF01F01